MVSGQSDEELLRAVGAGDSTALECLYSRYGGLCYALAQRVTRDPGLAEEIVQEAFLATWRRSSTYDPGRGSGRSWLLSVVHHRAIDALRARRTRGPSVPLDEDFPLAGSDDPEAEVIRTLDREAIRRALTKLPEAQRQCISLAYFGGLTCPEIAAQLDVPLGTVKSRLRIGLEKLRSLALGSELGPEIQRQRE